VKLPTHPVGRYRALHILDCYTYVRWAAVLRTVPALNHCTNNNNY